MSERAEPRDGRYLYAIAGGVEEIASWEGRRYGPIGIDGGEVYTISAGGLAAVVSDVPNRKIRPERRQLSAHHEVLKRLLGDTALPMSFGVIADSAGAIREILSKNRDALAEQLQRLAGKVEMGLRVVWGVPNIFEYFVHIHPELRAARDRLFGAHREPTQEEKIEMGRMFERILNEDREAHAGAVEEVLAPRCFEIRRNPPRHEREVMHLACLIGRAAQAEFEAGVFEAARRFDDNFAFDYNGPWAPHNFIEIDLKI
ncbi:MAG: gas vesicle protein GvpFL [Candidatus Handelsmanbacteria bacterium RIFCSPLOWO2_12_FULL_64_10]|uniref:Gas vesicle protein GvpFL n=1 Tax=Handelsmanbacteria sp. (strain RIFCSPLOWO2_12_FULL_64_10) TaxID=1817868 RepID=A0A1F6D773_HANXR|nr:MAG: gas vesicle protein GvpFL [Candidatus Handelsmanbacteria bacterium RIFCSPLOWO2_12_FULL_64_10]